MLPDVKLQQLRYFVLVAELKSYHAAAERAKRTQPALSLSIRELEQRVGESLFERGNKTALTPYGQHCYPLAKALLEHYGRVVGEMAMAAEQRIGRVSLACVPSFASRLLPDILGLFGQRHPDIQISADDDIGANVQQRVLNGFVDMGVANLWNVDSNLHFEPLLHDRMGMVCRSDHPAARSEGTIEWDELEGETLISNDAVRPLDGTRADEVMRQAQFSVSNTTSLLAMLRAGMGVTALPQLALDPHDDKLKFVPLSNPTIQRDLGILTPRRQSLSPGAKALRACILERMGGVSHASDVMASSSTE